MIVTARRCLRALPEPVASNITPVKPTTDVLATLFGVVVESLSQAGRLAPNHSMPHGPAPF